MADLLPILICWLPLQDRAQQALVLFVWTILINLPQKMQIQLDMVRCGMVQWQFFGFAAVAHIVCILTRTENGHFIPVHILTIIKVSPLQRLIRG